MLAGVEGARKVAGANRDIAEHPVPPLAIPTGIVARAFGLPRPLLSSEARAAAELAPDARFWGPNMHDGQNGLYHEKMEINSYNFKRNTRSNI